MRMQYNNFYLVEITEEQANDRYPTLVGSFDYYEFYTYNDKYLGAQAYRQFAADNITFNEFHTNSVAPIRSYIPEWQEAIGGIWLAVADPMNPNIHKLKNAAKKDGYIDCSPDDSVVILIKEYSE